MPNTSALLSKSATTSGRATVLPCVCVGLSGTRVLWLIQQWGNLALSEVSMRAIRNEVIPGSQMMTEWRAATRFERVTFALGGQTPMPQSRNNAFNQSQEWGVASHLQPRHSPPSYPALRCLAKPRYGSFMTSTAGGKLK